MDFSQSVSHLWKQFRRFGSKGDAAAGEAAAAHGGGGGGGGGGGERTCYNCGDAGHNAAQCPNPKSGGGRGGRGGGAPGRGGRGGSDSRLEYKVGLHPHPF